MTNVQPAGGRILFIAGIAYRFTALSLQPHCKGRGPIYPLRDWIRLNMSDEVSRDDDNAPKPEEKKTGFWKRMVWMPMN
jgi:hypothetical protein